VANLNTAVVYNGILSLQNVGTSVNYHGIFITLIPGPNVIKISRLFFMVNYCSKKLYYLYGLDTALIYCHPPVIYSHSREGKYNVINVAMVI
jgi:hypothetical protein